MQTGCLHLIRYYSTVSGVYSRCVDKARQRVAAGTRSKRASMYDGNASDPFRVACTTTGTNQTSSHPSLILPQDSCLPTSMGSRSQ